LTGDRSGAPDHLQSYFFVVTRNLASLALSFASICASLMECTLASLSLTVLNAKGKALMARPHIVPKKTTRGFALLKSLDLGIIELMMTN